MIGARGHYQPGGRPQNGLGNTRVTVQQREHIALSLFPQVTGVCLTHNWGGSVGAPWGWHPHIIQDKHYGIATAGGCVGEGVGASFLFGQTLAELLTEGDTDRTRMPWVTRRSLEELKRWEPEPFPRLGLKTTIMALTTEEWLLNRYGEGAPTGAVGWLCDQLDPHKQSMENHIFFTLIRT